MIYLVSGTMRSVVRYATLGGRLGLLLTPRNRNSVASQVATGLPWAVDNGAFSGFDPVAFRRLLQRVAGQPRLLWIACPDVVADSRSTLALFDVWRDEVAAAGPVALVGQDGLEGLEIPWEQCSCLFLGGSTRWKLSRAAADLAAEARARGKWVHVGRVNSRRRLRYCWSLQADSCDGSSASMFGDKYLPKYLGWINELLPYDRTGGHDDRG